MAPPSTKFEYQIISPDHAEGQEALTLTLEAQFNALGILGWQFVSEIAEQSASTFETSNHRRFVFIRELPPGPP